MTPDETPDPAPEPTPTVVVAQTAVATLTFS